MRNILHSDFEGYERQLQMLRNRTLKWGNSDDCVDSLAHDVVEMFADELAKHHDERGMPYAANMIPTTTHIWFGDLTGATPDGRRSRAPLSEGISPVDTMLHPAHK